MSYLRSTILGALTAATLAFSAPAQSNTQIGPVEEPVVHGPVANPNAINAQEFWEKNIQPARVKGFKTKRHVDVSPADFEGIKRNLIDGYKKAVDAGRVPQFQEVGMSVKTNIAHDVLNVTKEIFGEYEERVNRSLDDFFDYVGNPEDKTPTQFHLLSKNSHFQKSNTKAHCYVGFRQVHLFDASLTHKGTDKPIFGFRSADPKNLRGEVVATYELKILPNNSQIVFEPGYVMLYPGVDSIGSYAAPISEIAPFAIKPITAEHIAKNLDAWYEKIGRPQVIPMDQTREIVFKWDAREEGVVEGLIDCFMEENLDQLGFDGAEFEHYKRHGNRDLYRFVPLIREKVKAKGAKWVFQTYKTNPEVLFGEE